MKIAIRYLSKTGNTKKIADAISKELNVKSETIKCGISDDIDILFLGGAPYAFNIDKELKKFILDLDNKKLKVAIFTTSALTQTAYKKMKRLLKKKNIFVIDESFHCKGKYNKAHHEHPDKADLEKARTFARNIIKEEN